ncbi:MAG: lipopolysaccharide biosynthesis protein [Bacteroidota bacterium]
MDEVKKYLSLLKKYLWVLIIVPVTIVIITFFLVRNLPDSFVSQAQIATGIVDETKQYQQLSIMSQGMLQGDQILQQFSNLISMMKVKSVLDQVSYLTIIHDLSDPKPLKKKSPAFLTLNADARKHALDVFKELYRTKQPLNLSIPDQYGLYNVLASMGYDSESLAGKLNIFRSGASDFITIQCESESPELSAFIVNSTATEFVAYYADLVKLNKVKATDFLRTLLKEKTDTLATKMGLLRDYKIKNQVLNLDEQSKQLYSSIVEYENQKQQAIQNTSSYAGTINEIDRKFDPNERKYIEGVLSKVNQKIAATKDELVELYDAYYRSDFEDRYKNSIDSLQKQLYSEISKSSDQYITNPLVSKQALIQQKLDLEIKLDLSRYSMSSLEDIIKSLNRQLISLVPKEAIVQTYEMNIEIATKEYMDILEKYNQSSLEAGVATKLNVIQLGMPGLPQPSKKMLLVILSGFIGLIFCLAVFFVLYIMDRTILSPEELANRTQIPVLGVVSNVDVPSVDLKEIWVNDDLPPAVLKLKNQLRSVRYEIENEIKGKVLVFSSVAPLQGKTFLAMSLSFAWMMTNKKVLVIDGNFSNPTISEHNGSPLYLEDFLQGRTDLSELQTSGMLTVLKNKGGDRSLIEVADYDLLREKLNMLKSYFDLIVVETASMDVINQSKEWNPFADSIVGIFKCGQTLNRKENNNIAYLNETGLFIGWIMNKT